MFALACNLPKRRRIFAHRNYVKKNTCKQCGFFDHQNYDKKLGRNNVDFLTSEITAKKVRENNMDFSDIVVTSKKYVKTNCIFWPSKLHRKSMWKQLFRLSKLYQKSESNVEFMTRKITWEKLHISNALFSISENKSKRYVEMRWKFAKIWSWCIDVISTWCAH